MTSDRETAEAELVLGTAERLWRESQTGPAAEQGPQPIEDVAIAHECGLDVDTVRRWLDEAGDRFEVGVFGNTRTVVSLRR